VIALNRCNECGFIFRNPRPSAAEISAYYSGETQYDAWLGNEKAREAMWERRLRKLLRYRACGALLDAGTGTGQFLHIARSHFNVEGTEVSASAVKIAKES
jgi:2-polyprenyl-3-methyl-5-hydroxy-6-metoxy-1,4-benzoquinol methylase